ncbi:translocation/assembly module TamB domain-containing protein [Flavobacterium haoranii]|uniref:translocation/assembly module TamB domain-containing protein n=1 Tax=Flavobacterium haoranii TaxID=683124 RepID=UPI001D0F3667|nr:translocation/assembly module TamB domain-containing protein [Flavobacterium haoranii]
MSLPFVQTQLGKVATNSLNEEFGTDIRIGRVAISPFLTVKLGDVLVRDHHKDTLFYIKRLNTSILNFKKLYDNGHPYLGDVGLHGLDARIVQYKNEDETNLDKFVAAFDDGTPSSGKFRMSVTTYDVYNSRFRYIDENLENPKLLDFTQLNGKLNDFFIKGPDVTTNIEKLSFKDHRGLVVENLAADFTYTKRNILLENLDVHSKESHVKGRVELLYKREDFANFNDKVRWQADIKESVIASNDLNYFYDEFGKNNKFKLETELKGTLNNFITHNLHLTDSYNSEIIGDVNFKNLFKKGESFYINGDFDKIHSNYQNLGKILPRILGDNLPSSLAKLGEVNVSGLIELTDNYINSNVDLNSNIGSVIADLSIQDFGNIDNASYKGTLDLNSFNIGVLLNDSSFKNVTANVLVNGKGFTQKYLNTLVEGHIDQLYFNGYNYTNIDIDGAMKMPYFKGYFNSNDPNLRMDFKGLLDLSSKVQQYDFTSHIDYADLNLLNFNKNDSISIFKGNISLKAKGNSFDDLAGIVNLNNVSYQNSSKQFFFNDFNLQSEFDENKIRTITVNSPDIIEGKVVGKYKIKEVKKIVENAVGSLYANYSPNKLEKGQFLDFDFTIYNKIIEVFVPEVSISENTKIKGKISADDGKFTFDFTSPNILAYGNKFDNINIEIDNKNPLYNTYILMDSIRTKRYKISDFNLINVTLNDTLFVHTEFNGGNKNQDQYALNLYHTINEDKKSVVGFKKSELKLREYLWFINENETNDNKVVFTKDLKSFNFEKLSLSHNNQRMSFFGKMIDSTYKDLNLAFHDVDLEKIVPAIDSLEFNGKLNGFATLKQNKNVYKPESNIKIESFQINKYPLGDLTFNIEGNEAFNQFDVDAALTQDDEEKFYLDGTLDYINKQTHLKMEAGFDEFQLAPFGPLLSSIVSNVRGNATGRATIRGLITEPEVDGRLYLNDSGLKIPYLNTDYNFEENAIVDVTEHQFLFRNIRITDSKYNTNGVLHGSVKHEVFDDWEIDLEVKSDNLLALDTNDGEDVYYYGTAFMNGFATVKGPTDALVINVVGESEKGTSIKIPVSDGEEIGDNSFINFISEQEHFNEIKGIVTSKNKYQGLELDFDFDIDTDAEIEVILDRNSGHSMKGRGYGSMKMEINTLGKFLMYGDFIVVDGEYKFRYGGLIDKKFTVKSGGTIRWEGEPMNAILNLEAVYNTQANPAVLLESASFNRKVDTNVSILINGSLSNPEPDFNIDFPNVSSVLRSEIDYRLQDKDTRQTQALALLSTGSFMTAETAGNAAYGPLFERASSLFSDLFSDEDSKLQLGVDYSQGDRLNQISDRVGVTLQTKISDKISINGKVGVPVGGVTESVLVGNVEIQLHLNDDGTLKAHVFNRENDINYIGEGIGYTQGLGITYSVDFDNLKEFIQNIFPKKKQQTDNSSNSDDLPDSEFSPEYINFINDRKHKKSSDLNENEQQRIPEIE